MQTAQTDLAILGLHTDTPQVFWKGTEVTGITRANIIFDEDDSRVKFTVSGAQDAVYLEMIDAGIIIKKVS